ncbi:MAG: 16S rRNA (cytosine(967)-C(5))-methyltransferase RsmB [Thermodesulfobacteriota bacterium]
MTVSSRALAMEALVQLAKSQAPLDTIVGQLTRSSEPSRLERQLLNVILLTTLRRRREIDAVISHFSSRPLAKLEPKILAGLRVGTCQLLCLDKIPPSAAVNETVKGLGRQPKWLKGFVNGVLRAISRKRQQALKLMAECQWPASSNHPDWLAYLLAREYGQETAVAICRQNQEQPSLALRLNPNLTSREAYSALLTEADISWRAGQSPLALILPDFQGRVTSLPGFSQGLFHVMDDGAQLIPALFGPLTAGPFLDGCAGLGGKTIMVDQLLPSEAILTAVEPHSGRFSLLQENLQRCHCRPVTSHKMSLADFASGYNGPPFQAILLDAPCSGLGVMGRHPDIRWNRRPADLPRCQQQQLALLATAAPLLAPGGTIVYATCSLARLENEGVVEKFLEKQDDFTLLSGPALPQLPRLDEHGFLRLLPAPANDGFFAARLQKK